MKSTIIKMFIIFALACGYAFYLQSCTSSAKASVNAKLEVKSMSHTKVDYTNI